MLKSSLYSPSWLNSIFNLGLSLAMLSYCYTLFISPSILSCAKNGIINYCVTSANADILLVIGILMLIFIIPITIFFFLKVIFLSLSAIFRATFFIA